MAQSTIRLAILDDYQGIAPSIFQRLGPRVDVVSFPDTLPAGDEEALTERLRPFDVISTMRERTALTGRVLRSLSNLKLILTTGMKNSAIDIATCSELGIPVLGAKGLGTTGISKPPTSLDSTLEHTWALILGLARNVARDDAGVKSGGWEKSFATGLRGRTLGLLGLGKLGADTGRVGVLAFGMKVVAWSSSLTQDAANDKARAFGLPEGTFHVAESKESLLRAADLLSIHYVLSERSRDILGAKELALLKPTAILVNTSRGPLVNEAALLEILNQGKIKGVALDVYNTEPLPADSEWRTTPWGKDGRSEVLLSPHMGYVEEGVMNRWYEDSAANLGLWLDGKDMPTKLH
ncbi:D-isomer specific 2-hydroxyacid dehydrogenase [Aspergillus pseudoustus]|uniref:D-isomer specific 2-hydroxyacid dehydrogenase n=1 Tax=Aspergillus pseudoustus TaxID=1810923 RepID=A0ABR4JJ36_9EURO